MNITTIIIIMVVVALIAGSAIIYFTLFKKKKKLPFEFKVAVFVPSVDSMEQQTSIECVLKRDSDDQLLYIVDTLTNGKNFKEIYPGENKQIFIKQELPKIKAALTKKETDLKNASSKSLDNVLDLKKEVSKLKVLIKQYEEPKGSFVIKIGGNKVIFYLRKSTGNEAMHWDIHNNIAFSPTEKNSRDLFNAWKTKYENLKKDEKAPFEKVTQAIAAIVLVVIIIVLAILAWNWLQYDLQYAESMRTQAYVCQQESVKAFQNILATNQNTSNLLNDFTGNLLNGNGAIQGPGTDTLK